MSENWQTLAHEMSEISEQAFYAGWMDGLEHQLWNILQGGPRRYGQVTVTDDQVARLRHLSDSLGGWVWFNDDSGLEEFVDVEDWQTLHQAWMDERSQSK